MSEYSVFVCNNLVLDHSVFQLWLLGYNVEQAIDFALKKKKDLKPVIIRNFIISQVIQKKRQ